MAIDTRALNLIYTKYWYPELRWVRGPADLQTRLDVYLTDILNFEVRTVCAPVSMLVSVCVCVVVCVCVFA